MMCHMTPGVTCTYHIPRYCFENPIDCKTGGMLPDNVTVDFNTNTLYIDGVRQINPNEVDPNN